MIIGYRSGTDEVGRRQRRRETMKGVSEAASPAGDSAAGQRIAVDRTLRTDRLVRRPPGWALDQARDLRIFKAITVVVGPHRSAFDGPETARGTL
jgi:hypothetical protein